MGEKQSKPQKQQKKPIHPIPNENKIKKEKIIEEEQNKEEDLIIEKALLKKNPKDNKEENDEENEDQIEHMNNINFEGLTGGNNKKIGDSENIKNESIKKNLINKNNMTNKLEQKKNLNIDTSRNNFNKINNINEPFMMTADNFHSKKISFNNNKEQKKEKDNKIEKKEEKNNKNDSPIKNVMENFKINNDDNDINNDLPKERKISHKQIYSSRKKKLNPKNEVKYYNRENYDTINNEEDEINKQKRRNVILKGKMNNKAININNGENQANNSINKINLNKQKSDDINENLKINDELNLNNFVIINKNENNLNNNDTNKNEKKEEDIKLDNNININNLKDNNQNKVENKNEITKEKKIKAKSPEKVMKKFNSVSNFNEDVIIPQKIFLFENFNIFDSFITILNHNSYINNYLKQSKSQDKIFNCEKNNQYCLSSILFYINKYMWSKKPELLISKKNLKIKYKAFLDCYLQTNCNNSNSESYFFNTENLEKIIYFIFYKINKELTAESKKIEEKNNCSKGNMLLYKFMNDFMKNNNSIISGCFTGFYQEETTCLICKDRMQRYGNIYTPYKQYNSFNYLYFDLCKLNNQYSYIRQRSVSMSVNPAFYGNNSNQYNKIESLMNINLYDCLNQKFDKRFQSACNLCKLNTQQIIKGQLYSPLKVLTIIINNQDANLIIDSQINLSNYTHKNGNHNYCLVAILCKYTYNNQLITYCFNSKNGKWYSYSKSEGIFSKNVREAKYLEPNAIPYVLVYQNTENMDFEYNGLDLEKANKKKRYLFKFVNGLPQVYLYFHENATIKEVGKEISSYYDFKKVRLVVDAEKTKENDLLSIVAANSLHILVIPD